MLLGKMTHTVLRDVRPPETRTIAIGVEPDDAGSVGQDRNPGVPRISNWTSGKPTTGLRQDLRASVPPARASTRTRWSAVRRRARGLPRTALDLSGAGDRRVERPRVPRPRELRSRADRVRGRGHTILEGTVWAPIRYTESMRREGVPLKRADLLYGPYGMRQDLGGAVDRSGRGRPSGRSSRQAGTGQRSRTCCARLVCTSPPSCSSRTSTVNVDVGRTWTRSRNCSTPSTGSPPRAANSWSLMTTNHIERIHKGMLRPGRLDAVIEIACARPERLRATDQGRHRPDKSGRLVRLRRDRGGDGGLLPGLRP